MMNCCIAPKGSSSFKTGRPPGTGAAGLAVLFGDVGQLLHDDLVDACRALENILQVRNRVFEFFDFLGAL